MSASLFRSSFRTTCHRLALPRSSYVGAISSPTTSKATATATSRASARRTIHTYQARLSTATASTSPKTMSPEEKQGHAHTSEKTSAQDTGETGVNDWKTRPPYEIHRDDKDFHARHEGSCHCGKVRFQLSREKPLAAKFCHCTTCQVIHGAPFQWAAIFHKTDINFTHGHHDLAWYDTQEKSRTHHLPCKVGCAFCHTPIMDEGRNMILLFPTLVHFKSAADRALFAPTLHMFYPQRCVDVPDGKPKWTKLNDGEGSEIIEGADDMRLQA